ncbi:MAG: hypothetical protein ACPG45_03965 [Flavobacteriaceae bacterium]|mgnify:CR=1 FL=1
MKHLFLFCFILVSTSCKKQEEAITENHILEFNNKKWLIKEGYTYPNREEMLPVLFANDTLKKLQRNAIYNLLGIPNRTDKNYLFYTVSQRRIGFFPLHTKTLVIKLQGNDSLNKVMIHE